MVNFWNNTNPVTVPLPKSSNSPFSQPPLDNPLPNHILPAGFTPSLPTRAVPAAPINRLKQAINSFPSIFTIINGNH